MFKWKVEETLVWFPKKGSHRDSHWRNKNVCRFYEWYEIIKSRRLYKLSFIWIKQDEAVLISPRAIGGKANILCQMICTLIIKQVSPIEWFIGARQFHQAIELRNSSSSDVSWTKKSFLNSPLSLSTLNKPNTIFCIFSFHSKSSKENDPKKCVIKRKVVKNLCFDKSRL